MKKALTIIGLISACIGFYFVLNVVWSINQAMDAAENARPMEGSISAPQATAGMEKYDYFCSDGGPFILIPSSIKAKWKGSGSVVNVFSRTGDYWKACNVVSEEGSCGAVRAYSSNIFVVDSPLLATQKANSDSGFFIYAIIAWNADDLDGMIDEAVSIVKEQDFARTQQSVQCDENGFVFMYAGDVYGDFVYDAKEISAKAGIYEVLKASWKTDNKEVIVYQFTLTQ